MLRPQEIPRYVASGMFDLGITGRDWVEETGADVVTLTELHYSKATARPIRMVLAVAGDSPVESGRGSARRCAGPDRVPRAHPSGSSSGAGVDAEITLSYGATEAKIPEIADAVVEITETGRALRAAGLKIIGQILVVVHRADRQPGELTRTPRSARRWSSSMTLLTGALEARGRVLVKLNVDDGEPRRGHRAAAGAEVADGVASSTARTASRSRPSWRRRRSTP